ncbi:S8 family serine peptidase [Bacillus timonensis]|uniref:S8 family serine peptidase n=1 Tax=Bacillus timonensis TaxID=1033734 RepID=UPI00028A19E3|nr:S8 family serine peptidase [Bacillus timonensis]
MHRLLKTVAVISLVLPSLLIAPFQSSAETNQEDSESKRVIVKYKSNEFSSQSMNDSKNVEIIHVEPDEVTETIKEYEDKPNVEYVEEELEYSYFGTVNDPYFKEYQKLHFDYSQVTKAWDLYSPKKKIVIAVLDSGIDMNHPDLKNQIIKPYNAVKPGSQPTDNNGHGTHVAGLVGAQTNNKVGVASIAKNVSIMPVKVGDEAPSTIDIAEGIYYAVDNGANIINLSLGGAYSKYVDDAIQYAYNKGVIVVAASGNSSTSIRHYPAALTSVMSVAAIDTASKSLANYSNYGNWVTIAAPGTDLLSTVPTSMASNPYGFMSGTSMATPMVASFAGLLKGQYPNLNHNQLRWMMEYTSMDYNGSQYHQNGAINAWDAVQLYDTFARIYGKTSVDTSNEMALAAWESLTEKSLGQKKGKFVILASNQSFPDSLSAGALSYLLDTPILLTYPTKLNQSTVSTLKKLGATDVAILGGTVAVSNAVENSLKNNGFGTLRLKGDNRYKTASIINDYIAKPNGTVIVANGRSFPDALSISSFSASLQIPIVFVEKDKIPQETKDFLNKYKFSKTFVVGGTGVVSDKVLKSLPNPQRLSGKTRYETNVRVLQHFIPSNNTDGFLIATGRNFPDALSGGAVSAKVEYPLLLVDSTKIPTETNTFLNTNLKNVPYVIDMAVLGGKAAVSSETLWKLDAKLFDRFYKEQYSPSGSYQSTSSTKNELKFANKVK